MEPNSPTKASGRVIGLLAFVALITLLVDQGSKFLVEQNLTLGETVAVWGELLQFHYILNSGAAFSIGNAYTWIFSILATSVVVFIVWFARRIRSVAWAWVFGLLLGGVLGNLGDRLFREPGFGIGHVVDFLMIPLLPAIFNLADVAIIASMSLFLILTLRGIGLDGSRDMRQDPAAEHTDSSTPSVSDPDEQGSSSAQSESETSSTAENSDSAAGPQSLDESK